MLASFLLCLLLAPAHLDESEALPPMFPGQQAPAEAAEDAGAHEDATPATQPAEAASEEIDLIKVFKGEQKLTAEQLIEFGPWINAISTIAFAILAFIPRLFVAVVLLGLFYLIYRTFRRMIVGGMRKAKVDDSICDMLQSMLKWGILGFGMIVACNQLGIPIVAMLTGVSIIGLAVGFAAQETLANFIAGIVIFWDKPFKAGDWIEIDGHLAQVKRVTFRSTRLEDLDGDIVVYPNTAMLSTKVVNKSYNDITRCNVHIGIAYKESIARARAVLLATLNGDPRIAKLDEAEVVVTACSASSVDLLLRFWIREERYEDEIMHEYLEKAKNALDAAGIEIPFPHLQVLMEDTPALAALAPHARSTREAA